MVAFLFDHSVTAAYALGSLRGLFYTQLFAVLLNPLNIVLTAVYQNILTGSYYTPRLASKCPLMQVKFVADLRQSFVHLVGLFILWAFDRCVRGVRLVVFNHSLLSFQSGR